jgi:hypothetical protein
MRIHFFSAALVILFLAPFAAAGTADVVGSWDCEMYVEANAQTYPFKLEISDVNGSLEGSASSDMGMVVLESLKYEDSQLTFEIYLAEAGTIKFDLKISGKELAGTGGNYDFTGQVKGTKE